MSSKTKKRRNPDEDLRALERRARAGDDAAAAKLARLSGRVSGEIPPVEGDLWLATDRETVRVYVVSKQGYWHAYPSGARSFVNLGLTQIAETWVFRRARRLAVFSQPGVSSAARVHESAPDFTPRRVLLARFRPELPSLIRKYLSAYLRPGARVHVATQPGEWDTVYEEPARRSNPETAFAEYSASDALSGAEALSPVARVILRAIDESFGGQEGFTRAQLARESGPFLRAAGRRATAANAERTVSKALEELLARRLVERVDRLLTANGKNGAERFTSTLSLHDFALALRERDATDEGEALLQAQIAQEEAVDDFLSVPRSKPGKGKTYRPVIHRQKTKGHRLPPKTATRIRGAGYRVCNPLDPAGSKALERALRVSGGDSKQALRFLEGASDPASRAARNHLYRLQNPKDASMKKKTKKKARKPSAKKATKKPAKKRAAKKTPKRCSNVKKTSRSYRAGKTVRHAAQKTAAAAKNFFAGLVSKENPLSATDTALGLIAVRGKRGAARFARQQEKHSRGHKDAVEAKRWHSIRLAIRRIRLGGSPAAKPKKTTNPLSGVVAAMANPVNRLPVGRKIKWKDAPASMKKDPLARKAALLASRRLGIPMDEVVGEVCDDPTGRAPRHTASSGELVSFAYKTPLGSKDAVTRSGRRIVYDHKAGDQGRGKRATRPMLLVNDPKTGHPLLVSRRGSRPGFSSRRGQTG